MRLPESMRRAGLEVGYRLGGWPRRLAALVCVGLAGFTAVHDRPRPAPRAAPVVVATHDLAAGTVLRGADVALAQWPPAQIPPRAFRSLHQAVGVAVAAAMDQGEPITSARIRGPGITVGLAPGFVAATVAITSANTLAFIRPGDRVDLLAAIPADIGSADSPPTNAAPSTPASTSPSTRSPSNTSPPTPSPSTTSPSTAAAGSARVVASGVRVLAVLSAQHPETGDDSAGLVVAVDRTTALAIASVIDGSLTATLRMPP